MPEAAFDVYAYARQVILPALALQNHPFIIQRPGAGGTSSAAYKLVIERAPTLLVRIFDDIGRARRSAHALKHLERYGLPAPRLRHADVSVLNRITRTNGIPRYSTTETWIEGTRALELPDETAAALQLAQLLARFHSVSRSRWGQPTLVGEVRPYAKTTMRLATGMILGLQARGVLSPAQATEALTRFNSWMPMLLRSTTYHLCLNDANRRNFIVTPQKTMVAIDVQRISYEPCSEEVANALYHFCRRSEALALLFVEKYLEAATPSCRLTWSRTGPFFVALNTLKRLHHKTAQAGDVEAMVPVWREVLLTLRAPTRVWPDPGSDPPADSTELSRQSL